ADGKKEEHVANQVQQTPVHKHMSKQLIGLPLAIWRNAKCVIEIGLLHFFISGNLGIQFNAKLCQMQLVKNIYFIIFNVTCALALFIIGGKIFLSEQVGIYQFVSTFLVFIQEWVALQ